MFKVVSAELKKMVSKPGIYVLSVLLAVILILGVFIYKPTVYEDKTITLTGKSFSEKLYSFEGDGVRSGEKVKYDDLVTATVAKVSAYVENGKAEDRVNTALDNFNKNLIWLRQMVSPGNNSPENKIEERRQFMQEAFINLRDEFIKGVDAASNGSYYIVTSQLNYTKFCEVEKKVRDAFPEENNEASIERFCAEYNTNYKQTIEDCVKNLIYPTLSEDLVKEYTASENSKIVTVRERLDKIYADIQKIDGASNESISELERLANQYISTANGYANLVKYELLSNAFSFIPTKQQIDLQYLNSETKYDSNTQLIRYSYLFDHNAVEEEYAQPLTIGFSSNTEVNAYDYAHFIMKLFSFIIIIYSVMNVCHSIGGEAKDGTMRYLAIRPVTRTSLVMGKFLAAITMSTILILFSGIISLAVGGAVYGFSSLKILTIFNGKTAFTIYPLAMFVISLLSILIELIVYTSIAALVACLIKSDLLSVTLMILFYLLNYLLPIVVTGSANSALSFYPFVHTSLYALFGSSIYSSTTSFLNLLLGAKIFANTSIWLTSSVVIILIALCLFLATRIFKRKEF